MMIRTTIPVNYNYGVSGNKTGIVSGHIKDASWVNDFNCVGINYTYSDDSNGVVFTDSFTVENEEVEEMHEAIRELLPIDSAYRQTERLKFHLGFAFKMAQTFGIETTDIEIIQ
jgi:hypothetical protein